MGRLERAQRRAGSAAEPNSGPLDVLTLPGGTETVLVAEDDEPIRRWARRALEAFGYRVLLAADGAEALELFRAHEGEIDLVIADVEMPKLGGRQLHDVLRRAGVRVKVLLFSRCAEDGPVPFLRKPWSLLDLVTKVRRVLDER